MNDALQKPFVAEEVVAALKAMAAEKSPDKLAESLEFEASSSTDVARTAWWKKLWSLSIPNKMKVVCVACLSQRLAYC
ncbi:hypothetical protein TIFTF001_018625 [Ficus carica]|uniref:Uncharacterized protein n=1 Tax=Ficus carica TaxID=3494 RepID=A0AA88DJ92_FICCA|nr:hypothetical protein TIFTF001_018625 [Ficus carica]